MKSERQNKILQLIKENVVETQEEILSYLREHGYDVTQATVSRDIRRLQLVKVQTADGHYRYAPAARAHTREGTAGLHAIVSQTVQKVDYANNLIVIKCFVGMANAACAVLDSMDYKEIVGTLSGDDTILVVVHSEEQAAKLTRELKETFSIS